jgi:hypothetical protein
VHNFWFCRLPSPTLSSLALPLSRQPSWKGNLQPWKVRVVPWKVRPCSPLCCLSRPPSARSLAAISASPLSSLRGLSPPDPPAISSLLSPNLRALLTPDPPAISSLLSPNMRALSPRLLPLRDTPRLQVEEGQRRPDHSRGLACARPLAAPPPRYAPPAGRRRPTPWPAPLRSRSGPRPRPTGRCASTPPGSGKESPQGNLCALVLPSSAPHTMSVATSAPPPPPGHPASSQSRQARGEREQIPNPHATASPLRLLQIQSSPTVNPPATSTTESQAGMECELEELRWAASASWRGSSWGAPPSAAPPTTSTSRIVSNHRSARHLHHRIPGRHGVRARGAPLGDVGIVEREQLGRPAIRCTTDDVYFADRLQPSIRPPPPPPNPRQAWSASQRSSVGRRRHLPLVRLPRRLRAPLCLPRRRHARLRWPPRRRRAWLRRMQTRMSW